MIINGKEIKKLGNYYYLLTILYSRRNKIKVNPISTNSSMSKDNSLNELGNKLKESNLLNEHIKSLDRISNKDSCENELKIERIYDLLLNDLVNDEYVIKANVSEEIKYLTEFHKNYIKNHCHFFKEKNANIDENTNKYSCNILSEICLETINPIVRLAAYSHLKSLDENI